MTIEELNQQIKVLVARRAEKDEIKAFIEGKTATFNEAMETHRAALEDAMSTVVAVQAAVLHSLKELEIDSFKTKTNTVSLKRKASFHVTDEKALIAGLYAKNLNHEYVVETVKPEVKGIFDQLELPGVEKTETEYISILNRKTDVQPTK
jgi:hypothetical protein